MRDIRYIVLHCTATSRWTTVDAIQRYWRDILGWKAPGYHRIIEPDGKVHILCDYGKPTNGVKGHNMYSIHISYIGGIDGQKKPIDNRTKEQIASMRTLVLEAKAMWPNAEVLGHRDFPGVSKACPSFDARKWYSAL